MQRQKEKGEKMWRKKKKKERIAQRTQQCTGCPCGHKRGEEERESAREKIELNSLILNYYLSIMGGMEPGRCAGED